MGAKKQQIGEQQIIELMSAVDCFSWIINNNLELSHGPWKLKGHEYQVDWLQCNAKEQVFIKGAQIGATEALVLKTIHGMIHGHYPQGVMYLFPTRDDVRDFSKARFDPLIDVNPQVGSFVTSTDAQNIKKIGKGYLYLRGARSTKNIGLAKKSSSQLKSAPVDRVVFDERDEMEDDMVTLARERVSHSEVQELIQLGTPTIPDYGVDALYQKSTQNVWMIKCEACGKETCLDLEFPNGIELDEATGKGRRVCIHCGNTIYPHNGRWEWQYKDRDLVGWWISQLNSIYVDPGYIVQLYNDPPHGDLSEVMNSKLGRAYIPAENRLAPNDVYACMGQDSEAMSHDGPAAMGVDVGKVLHVVIAVKKTQTTLKVIKTCRVDSFNDLHDLAKRYGVRSAVIDLKPEIRKVREFQQQEPYLVYACDYLETRAGGFQWDDKEQLIRCNRTEICDATHDLVIHAGRLELPRRHRELDEFVKEMCNLAKVLEENPETGSKVYKYKAVGTKNDHYRHAMNYCYLAAERIGSVSDKNLIKRFFSTRRKRSFMTA